MKLSISLSSIPPSAKMSKFFKSMAFNPNEGTLAAWLFKLPALKLPSIRPALSFYTKYFVKKGKSSSSTATLVTTFPRESERKFLLQYFEAKKFTAIDVAEVIPFLAYLSKTLVDSSPVFRAHYGDEKAVNALLQFLLCGTTSATTPANLKKIFEKIVASDSIEFNPSSLADITRADLQSHRYNELEVAAKINKLTKEWFAANIDLDRYKEDQHKRSLDQFKYYIDGSDTFINVDTGKALTEPQARKLLKDSFGDVTVGVKNVRGVTHKTFDFEPLTPTIAKNTSPVQLMFLGSLVKFQKTFPELAAFFLLCTPIWTSAINEIREEDLKPERLDVYRQNGLSKDAPTRKALLKEGWMEKYVSEKVLTNSKLGVAESATTWMKLQALPKKSLPDFIKKEMQALTLSDIENLDSSMLRRIQDAVGAEQSLSSVFKDVLDSTAFKQKFLSAYMARAAEMDSPFGPISAAHLNTNLKAGDVLLSPKSVEKWTPIKEPIESFKSKITRKVSSLDEGTAEEAKALRTVLEQFMTHGHGVDFEIVRHWDVPLSAVQKKHLKAAQEGVDYYVVRNGFHGTSTSAAGAILLSGFRMSSEFVKTAQSMGPVLYIAPNIDKSLQYIGHSFGRDAAYGIIFHGDLVVHGANPPQHTKEKGLKDWTKTQFATEEIGLVHPNSQFLVRKAYLVKRTTGNVQPHITERSAFASPIPASTYTYIAPLAAVASKLDYAVGERVAAREKKNKWFLGVVVSVDQAVHIKFDDGATAEVEQKDFKHLKKVNASRRKNPNVLTDAEVEAILK